MNKAIDKKDLKQLYGISFIEGGVVMVTEIAGAKLLTPYFGATLYSWAATLSITLLALMLGYYSGGYVTTKPKYTSIDKIIWVFFLSGLTVLLMPFLSRLVMQKTISFSFFSGLIISELLFLFIPIFLMGMISPMIIFQVTKKVDQSGRSAGNIYAISTCGGILFTLVFGFLIIPYYGITLPVKVLGLSVVLLAVVLLIKEKARVKRMTLAAAVIISLLAFSQNKPVGFSPRSNMKLVDYSEGLLGELKVVDELTYSPDGSEVHVRKLRTNNVQQNFVFVDKPEQSLMYYVNFSKQLIQFLPEKENALLIGLGAGSLYSVLNDQKINVVSVEIDKRIYDMGVKYFGMREHKNNFIIDGRYYINVTNKKYDLIVLDVIVGENVPAQLVTLESFKRCYDILNKNGTLLIEHGGVNSFQDNSFIPSVVKTLTASGFHVTIFNPTASKNQGDIMFLATKAKFELKNKNITNDVLIEGGPLANYILPLSTFDNRSPKIFTDDRNDIDLMLRSHYLLVRKGIRKELAKMNSLRNA